MAVTAPLGYLAAARKLAGPEARFRMAAQFAVKTVMARWCVRAGGAVGAGLARHVASGWATAMAPWAVGPRLFVRHLAALAMVLP